MSITAKLDTKAFEDKLRIFSSGLGGIYKELLDKVGQQMASEAKTLAPRRTGKLANSINFSFSDDMTGILSTKKRLNKSNVWYALMVEKGAKIKTKKSDYLTFKVNGEWKKVKSVSREPKPFFYPVIDDYFGKNTDKGFRIFAEALSRKMNEEFN